MVENSGGKKCVKLCQILLFLLFSRRPDFDDVDEGKISRYVCVSYAGHRRFKLAAL